MRARKFGLVAWSGLLWLLGAACPGIAQDKIVGVKIYTQPEGLQFTVDGMPFTSGALLLWPEGSKHFIATTGPQYSSDGKTKYDALLQLNSNLGILDSMPITADRELHEITLTFQVFYRVDLFFDAPGGGRIIAGGCPSGGEILENLQAWCGAGSTVALQAYPNSGYVFTGWTFNAGFRQSNAFIYSATLFQPMTVTAHFPAAWPVQITPVKVMVDSSPGGLQLLADRTPVTSPATLEWRLTSIHSVGTIPAQWDGSRWWAFDSWSDGGPINHDLVVSASSADPISITAQFKPAAVVNLAPSPSWLKITVDGSTNWPRDIYPWSPYPGNPPTNFPPYTFVWANGSVHTVSAPAEQLDSYGRKYRFRGWSGGQPATFNVTASDGLQITANYDLVSEVRVESYPSGVSLMVDGSACTTPCVVDRPSGTPIRLSPPLQAPSSTGSRLVFQKWGDGYGVERTVTSSDQLQTFTVYYGVQHRLSLATMPGRAAAFRVQPAGADGYYDEGTRVSVAADPNPGFHFQSWQGDLAGSRNSGIVTMSGPKSAVALFNAAPFIYSDGVENGASREPGNGVAAGSVISVLGANLAPEDPAADPSPVSLRVGGRQLKLLMTSSQELRAQLPADLPEGEYQVAAAWGDKPEASATFNVVRNAPGLFFDDIAGRPAGLFLHENGDPVTLDQPAQAGELITVLATGLGSHDGTAAVQLISGESAWNPEESGAAAAPPGVEAVPFRLASGLAQQDGYVPLRLAVNGAESNTVFLPVAP